MSVIETPAPAVVEPPVSDPAYEAALQGADFLDRKLGPNWEDRINQRRLNMRWQNTCVLGRLFRSWWRPDGFRVGAGRLRLNSERCYRLGFLAGPKYNYSALTAAWKRVLTERRKARES